MGKSLVMCVFLIVTAAKAGADENLYLAVFAIFPTQTSKGCAFVMARDVDQKSPPDFRPSLPFMKAACSHFHAVWQADIPANVTSDYESAVWHKESPDLPTFLQQASM
jgi:hypothetical protein